MAHLRIGMPNAGDEFDDVLQKEHAQIWQVASIPTATKGAPIYNRHGSARHKAGLAECGDAPGGQLIEFRKKFIVRRLEIEAGLALHA